MYKRQFINSFKHSKNEWILLLGSDEYIPENLAKEIMTTIKSTQFDGFKIPSLIYVLNKWIVDFPCKSRNVRLARKSKALFLEKRIHESMTVNGRIGHLTNPYYHYQDNSVSERLKKLDKYTTYGALQRRQSNECFSTFSLFYRPFKYFIWQFIFLKKFTQGIRGLYLSVLKAFYQFIEEIKLYEMEVSERKK